MDKYVKANAVLSIFIKRYEKLKKDLPIRPSEMGVLNIITETEGLYTPVVLAEMLDVSKPMITAHITSLLNKGYVTKQPSKEDKRAYYIFPTEKAKSLVKSVKKDLDGKLGKLMSEMGEDNFDEFVRLAEKANNILA